MHIANFIKAIKKTPQELDAFLSDNPIDDESYHYRVLRAVMEPYNQEKVDVLQRHGFDVGNLLRFIVYEGSLEDFQYHRQKYPHIDVNNVLWVDGNPLVFSLTLTKNTPMLGLLLEAGARVDVVDGRGCNPVHAVLKQPDHSNSSVPMVKMLHEAGVSIDAPFGEKLPLELAMENKKDDSALLLLRLGCELPSDKSVDFIKGAVALEEPDVLGALFCRGVSPRTIGPGQVTMLNAEEKLAILNQARRIVAYGRDEPGHVERTKDPAIKRVARAFVSPGGIAANAGSVNLEDLVHVVRNSVLPPVPTCSLLDILLCRSIPVIPTSTGEVVANAIRNWHTEGFFYEAAPDIHKAIGAIGGVKESAAMCEVDKRTCEAVKGGWVDDVIVASTVAENSFSALPAGPLGLVAELLDGCDDPKLRRAIHSTQQVPTGFASAAVGGLER